MNETSATQTIIAEDIDINGSIKSGSSIQFDGKLNGDLTCAANAVIGANAVVKGNISAESAIIKGQVNGNINARDRIELKSTAKLNGDIRAKRLTVEDGVTFVGKSEVNPSGPGRPAGAPEARPVDEREDEGVETDAETNKGKGIFQRK
jgi:cytoskeletal protein CcmA (bactofilin family)